MYHVKGHSDDSLNFFKGQAGIKSCIFLIAHHIWSYYYLDTIPHLNTTFQKNRKKILSDDKLLKMGEIVDSYSCCCWCCSYSCCCCVFSGGVAAGAVVVYVSFCVFFIKQFITKE